MSAFNGLNEFFDEKIIEVAKNMNYSKENVLILEGCFLEVEKSYPKLVENLLSCRHQRDSRNMFEYAQDLIASWVFEDYLLEEFILHGMRMALSGADKKREILSSSAVKTDSDLSLEVNGKRFAIEVMNDYNGHWKKYHRVDLRDNKFLKLQKEKAIFIGISLKTKEYFVCNFNNTNLNFSYRFIERHFPYGGKPVYQIILNDSDLKYFDIEKIILDLKEFTTF